MTLYHYTTSQGLKGIVEKSCFHCSLMDFMNDPTEGVYYERVREKVFESNKRCAEIFKTLYIENTSFDDDTKNTFVLSFSKNRDSLTLWNHYAKGDGYNIGIDTDYIIKNKPIGLAIEEVDVIYSLNEQIESLKNFILGFENQEEEYYAKNETINNSDISGIMNEEIQGLEYEIDLICENFTNEFKKHCLRFKHNAYQNEEEVRLVIYQPIGPYENENIGFNISLNGVFRQYIELNFDISKALVRLTLHPLHNELHSRGLGHFLSSKISSGFIIYRSEIPFRIV